MAATPPSSATPRRQGGARTRAMLQLILCALFPPAHPLATHAAPGNPRVGGMQLLAARTHRAVLRRRPARASRALVACAEAQGGPDADLASAWLDDSDAGVLHGAAAVEVDIRQAFEHARTGMATIVDLRTAEQFANGHTPGSVNIPAGEPGPSGLLFHFRQSFESDVQAQFGADSRLLLLCEVGVVSQVAAERLLSLGMSAASVRGGYEAWCMEETLPIESESGSIPSEHAALDVPLFEGEAPENWDALDAAQLPTPGQGFTGWSMWNDEEVDFVPVFDMGFPDEDDEDDQLDDFIRGQGGDFDDDEEDEDFDEPEMAAPPPPRKTRAPPSAPAAPPPSPSKVGGEDSDAADDSELDLDELTKLLGEGQSKELPYFSSSTARTDGASVSPATAAGTATVPSPPPSYYAASATSYGGPSRAPKGVKTRRTRGGLPPAWLVEVSEADVQGAAVKGTLDRFSVKELKSFLYYRDAPLSGPKKELIVRIGEVLERETREEATREQRREERGEAAAQGRGAATPSQRGRTGAAAGPSANGASPQQGGSTMFFNQASQGSAPGDDRLIDEVFAEM